MRVVWKFLLGPGVTTLHLPKGAITLSAGAQGQDVFLWAYVDPDPNIPKEDRTFVAVGTGTQFEEGPIGPFIGTVHVPVDPILAAFLPEMVFHVFERDPE